MKNYLVINCVESYTKICVRRISLNVVDFQIVNYGISEIYETGWNLTPEEICVDEQKRKISQKRKYV